MSLFGGGGAPSQGVKPGFGGGGARYGQPVGCRYWGWRISLLDMARLRMVVVGALVLGSIQPAVAAPRSMVDPKVAVMAALDYCESASQLDCIESITVIDTDGGRYSAKRTFSPTGQSNDSYNQVVEEGSSDWNYINKAGKEIAFTVDATLTTPAFVVSGSESGDTETGSPTDGGAASETPPVDSKTLDTRT